MKLFGSAEQEQKYKVQREPITQEMLEAQQISPVSQRHGMRVLLGADILELSESELEEKLHFFENYGFRPVIYIDHRELSARKCREIILKVMESLKEKGYIEIIIMYSDLGQYHEINKLIEEINQRYLHDEIHALFVG